MKPDSITPELFAKLVTLAALELTPEESEYLRTELNHQLAAVQELSEIQLAEGVQPSLHGLECQGSAPRPDAWIPFPNSAEILKQAPDSEGGYFRVPDFSRGEVSE
ncbi:MAG TPA: aspartyl/glutamyl-tRNA amidotransferase subunit C [Anaerolineaceae bacterium]|jgi:aspartyl-tRNA(Asn)/glutamyl-tRNA(Gln) amidotransferase subunit C|nr:aspartyl/glutamyl-tRNA amidotransferase subunit C [Anaerolineaceae bacterium]